MTKAKAGGEQPVEIPDTLPILPLRNSVLFPGAIIPIDVGRRKSVRLVEDAIAKERPVIGMLTQKDARTEDPGAGDLYMVGCAARILKVIKLAKDNFSVILQGVSRFEVSTFDGAEPFFFGKEPHGEKWHRQQHHQAQVSEEELPEVFHDVHAKAELHIENQVSIKVIAAQQQKHRRD